MEFCFKLIITILLLSCIISNYSFAFASSDCNPTTNFIQTECMATRFSKSCFTLLAPFACKISPGDQAELCRAALRVSVTTSQDALQTLEGVVKTNPTEAGVISDCISTYHTIIDYITMASQMMDTRVINESSLLNLKQQISGIMDSVADWESGCLKNGDHSLRDDLKKKLYGAVAPCIKLNKIISSLVNRIHL